MGKKRASTGFRLTIKGTQEKGFCVSMHQRLNWKGRKGKS